MLRISIFNTGGANRTADVQQLIKQLKQEDRRTANVEHKHIPGFEGYYHTEQVKRVGDFMATIQRLSKRLCTRRRIATKQTPVHPS